MFGQVPYVQIQSPVRPALLLVWKQEFIKINLLKTGLFTRAAVVNETEKSPHLLNKKNQDKKIWSLWNSTRTGDITTLEKTMQAYQLTKRSILVKIRRKKDVTAYIKQLWPKYIIQERLQSMQFNLKDYLKFVFPFLLVPNIHFRWLIVLDTLTLASSWRTLWKY